MRFKFMNIILFLSLTEKYSNIYFKKCDKKTTINLNILTQFQSIHQEVHK